MTSDMPSTRSLILRSATKLCRFYVVQCPLSGVRNHTGVRGLGMPHWVSNHGDRMMITTGEVGTTIKFRMSLDGLHPLAFCKCFLIFSTLGHTGRIRKS